MATLGTSAGTVRLDLVMRPTDGEPASGTVATLDIPLAMGDPVRTDGGVSVPVSPDLAVLERLRAFLESESDQPR